MFSEYPTPHEFDFQTETYRLDSETILELLKSTDQHRFIRVDSEIWVMNAENGNHLELVTEDVGLSESDIAKRVQDAGFFLPVPTMNILAISGHSSHLESYLSKRNQLKNRPITMSHLEKLLPAPFTLKSV